MRSRIFLQSAAAAGIAWTFSPELDLGRAPGWNALKRRLGDRHIDIRSPLVECAREGGAGADALFAALKNPYYLSDEPALTQSLGWIDAWTTEPSLTCVAAESANDVGVAINFCRSRRVPLVVKGGGHSCFGNSNRAGSLLLDGPDAPDRAPRQLLPVRCFPRRSCRSRCFASNLSEAAQVLHAYQSAWLPSSLLANSRRGELVEP